MRNLIILLFINLTYGFNFNRGINKPLFRKPLLKCELINNNNLIEHTKNTFNANKIENIRYSEFIYSAENGYIDKTYFVNNDKNIIAIDKDKNKYTIQNVNTNNEQLFSMLHDNNIDIIIDNTDYNMLQMQYGLIIYFLISFIILRYIRTNIMSNTLPELVKGNFNNELKYTNTTFSDVVGIDNAKIEVEEVVEFLRDNKIYQDVGAKIPSGILLQGPPGTGKTLLARAIAGEAKVPFFSVSGSEFIEMFVGTGAARVRTLFETAKEYAPCIIFIDEIDAIGKQRSSNGMGAGNDEREQTLNQILTEMDGFETNTNVIVIAATNRIDTLDKALLRPGRFDRQIFIDNPDYNGRKEILELYIKDKPIKEIDIDKVSKKTAGFSPASLANLINEAAILTVRNNKTLITNKEIDDALDKITLGPVKKNIIRSEKNKELVAFHEAGHAIVGAFLSNFDTIGKVSIAPRGNAGGLTFLVPDENILDSGLYTRDYLMSMITFTLGGRMAEELIFGKEDITSGASNDLERVTSLAKRMVTEFGMSSKLGNVVYNDNISKNTNNMIYNEIEEIINKCNKQANKILQENMNLLKNVAKKLIDEETINSNELTELIEHYNLYKNKNI
jgi:cell division protease FtsH